MRCSTTNSWRSTKHMPSDAQYIEGIKNQVTQAVDFAPRITLPLLSGRNGGRCDMLDPQVSVTSWSRAQEKIDDVVTTATDFITWRQQLLENTERWSTLATTATNRPRSCRVATCTAHGDSSTVCTPLQRKVCDRDTENHTSSWCLRHGFSWDDPDSTLQDAIAEVVEAFLQLLCKPPWTLLRRLTNGHATLGFRVSLRAWLQHTQTMWRNASLLVRVQPGVMQCNWIHQPLRNDMVQSGARNQDRGWPICL